MTKGQFWYSHILGLWLFPTNIKYVHFILQAERDEFYQLLLRKPPHFSHHHHKLQVYNLNFNEGSEAVQDPTSLLFSGSWGCVSSPSHAQPMLWDNPTTAWWDLLKLLDFCAFCLAKACLSWRAQCHILASGLKQNSTHYTFIPCSHHSITLNVSLLGLQCQKQKSQVIKNLSHHLQPIPKHQTGKDTDRKPNQVLSN